MLSLRHSIGNASPLESLAGNSKSVLHLWCYATPPPTENYALSDFYAAYDAMNCAQQKCLIHLMRDLNTDLLKQPFNGDLKALVQAFALLLKPIIETVDRFGLTAQHLQKHKPFVGRFYDELSKHEYQSDLANSYKKRFEKNKEKLFTFLDYDGIPWNNNNAEHAIKAFASLRKVIGGVSTEKGIREYLTLLSVCETCKYKLPVRPN